MSYRQIAKACHTDDCCPKLYVDDGADASMRVMITDDFGAEAYMSIDQFQDLIRQAQEGELLRSYEAT